MFNLEHILSPLLVREFLTSNLNEKAVHIPGGKDKFPDLFDWEQINDQINFSRPSRESIRLIYEKQPLEHSQLARLAEWMVKGATLVINSVQQIDPIVSRFATVLGNDMNAAININCYASYPSKQGFNTHYDGHDVFIIHTSGKKSWKVFEPTRRFPLDNENFPKGQPPEENPYLECDMEVGDVLYIPRGHWHYALASEPSVHLTVSNKQRSGIDFIKWLTDQWSHDNEFLRQDFPVVKLDLLGGDQSNELFELHFERFREEMKKIIDSETFTENFLQYCMVMNPVPRNFQMPELALMSETITPTTKFTMAMEQKILTRFDPDTEKGQLIIRGHVLNMNNVGKNILEILSNSTHGETISGEQLQKANLKAQWEDIKQLLVFLFENGILQVE